MINGAVSIPVIKVHGNQADFEIEYVVEETPLTIFYNEDEIATVLCSPSYLEELTLGFLKMEGFIQGINDIHSLSYDPTTQTVRVIGDSHLESPALMSKRHFSACCGKSRSTFAFSNDSNLAKVSTSIRSIKLDEIYKYTQVLQTNSPLFEATGGVHSGGIAYQGEILYTSYDIGRHNVLDKLAGQALRAGHDLNDHVLFFSGRISSEILTKVSKMNIPILIARSAPTDMALNLARNLCITVIGFARGERFNIYTCPERVMIDNAELSATRQEY